MKHSWPKTFERIEHRYPSIKYLVADAAVDKFTNFKLTDFDVGILVFRLLIVEN